MNKIPASVFLLCIVKLQDFCYKYSYSDYTIVADLLIEASRIDGKEINSLLPDFSEIRNCLPFSALDLSQEIFVYSCFKQLKGGI